MDSAEFGEKLVGTLQELIGENLRSVVGYTQDNYTLHYVRDDVQERYTEAEIEEAVAEMRLETLEKEYLNTVFQRRHGRLYSRVVVFEKAVEMNFTVKEGEGLSIAVDTEYFARETNVIKTVMNAIEEYTEWELRSDE